MSFAPADLVALFDVWGLLAVLWASRFLTGRLDPAVAMFGIAAAVLLVNPRLQTDRLTVSAVEDSGSIFKKVAYAYAIAAALATVVQLGNGRV
ncbi:MAG TPA: hypothetical protein VFS18_01380, partial [Actinomycetota bacterium]|nr:hypothetical protein [Actinomycetota bacterium]